MCACHSISVRRHALVCVVSFRHWSTVTAAVPGDKALEALCKHKQAIGVLVGSERAGHNHAVVLGLFLRVEQARPV